MARIASDKLIEFLSTKWQGRPCPVCGVGGWSVQESSFELREFNEGNHVMGGGPVIPVVPVICTNCGNTVLVNAIMAGLVAPEAKVAVSTK